MGELASRIDEAQRRSMQNKAELVHFSNLVPFGQQKEQLGILHMEVEKLRRDVEEMYQVKIDYQDG